MARIMFLLLTDWPGPAHSIFGEKLTSFAFPSSPYFPPLLSPTSQRSSRHRLPIPSSDGEREDNGHPKYRDRFRTGDSRLTVRPCSKGKGCPVPMPQMPVMPHPGRPSLSHGSRGCKHQSGAYTAEVRIKSCSSSLPSFDS
ncbi:hypothetical protein V8E36_005714 [Tilletia maclaganii]